MSVFRHYQSVKDLGATVAAIGNFDGVHRGHQGLLNLARERAEHHSCATAALTFILTPLRWSVDGRLYRRYILLMTALHS